VDNGIVDRSVSLVGANTSLVAAADGAFYVAYQDATRNDLRLARRGASGSWTSETPLSDGAWGYYASLAISGRKLFLSNLRLGLDAQGRRLNEVRVLVRDLP
jgi:hypothetical protein